MIGISSPSFSLLPLEEVAESLSKHFSLWEIVAEAEHSIVDNKRKVKDILASYDFKIQLHAPISDLNIGSLVPGMRSSAFQSLWETMDAAHDLGIEKMTIHPGYLSPIGFYAPEKVRTITKKTIMELEKVNRAYGLKLCLENMPAISIMTGTSPEEIEEYLSGTEMMFCLDIGHANTAGNLQEFKRLVPSLGNVHAHDNNGREDQHLKIGLGNIDWNGVKTILSGYKGTIIIESRNLTEGVGSLKNLEKLF